MKRIFSILAVAVTLLAASVFSSCQKGESLNNTTWCYQATIPEMMTTEMTYQFTSDKDVTFTTVVTLGKSDPITISVKGTYVYKSPNVEITFTNGKSTEKHTGTISGNTLTITQEGKDAIQFTKK